MQGAKNIKLTVLCALLTKISRLATLRSTLPSKIHTSITYETTLLLKALILTFQTLWALFSKEMIIIYNKTKHIYPLKHFNKYTDV
jgi:hypothetical protein